MNFQAIFQVSFKINSLFFNYRFLRHFLFGGLILLFSLGCTQPENRRVGVEADENLNSYYIQTYPECTKAFERLIQKVPNAKLKKIGGFSQKDKDLTMDVALLPATKKKEVLFIISLGVHGGEGYVGSALLRYFIENQFNAKMRQQIGLLAVHGVNPYGFKNFRRTTENNVDLNRNFPTIDGLYERRNEAYRNVDLFLNPRKPVDLSLASNRFFTLRAFHAIATKGFRPLRQAILQGQYRIRHGIFYGGNKPEPQIKLLEKLYLSEMKKYKSIIKIDLHTGYGERGKLHLLAKPSFPTQIKKDILHIFGKNIEWDNKEDFYLIYGDFLDWTIKLASKIKKRIIPIVFEYGTLDSQTILGSIESLHRVILENQGKNYGYKSKIDKEITQKKYREMFFPSAPDWRTKVIQDSERLLSRTLKQALTLPPLSPPSKIKKK